MSEPLEVFKVLRQDGDRLRSYRTEEGAWSLEYVAGEVTKPKNGTLIFVFGTRKAARHFAELSKDSVIWIVEVEEAFELNEMACGARDFLDFWSQRSQGQTSFKFNWNYTPTDTLGVSFLRLVRGLPEDEMDEEDGQERETEAEKTEVQTEESGAA